METFDSYFLYENDSSNLKDIFDNLSKQMKIIHSHGMVIPNLSSKTIGYNENGFSFLNMSKPINFEADKRLNILSLAKLMLGTYLSSTTGFKDFSSIQDSWFIDNINDIVSSITDDDFEGEYFINLFNGSNEYFCDYLDRKKQNETLGGRENVSQYKKVLKTAASSLYEDQSYEDDNSIDIENKTASINVSFYLMLIGCSILVATCVSIFIKIMLK